MPPLRVRLSRPSRLLLVILATVTIWYTLRHYLTSPPLAKYNPWARDYRIETYDFLPTALESKCFKGELNLSLNKPAFEPIPNVVHFIWGLQDAELDLMAYIALTSARVALRPREIKLHHVALNKENEWWKRVSSFVTAVPHDLESEFGSRLAGVRHVAHVADVLRLDILYREGGIYMDMDVVSLHSFTNVLNNARDVVLGHEGGNRWGLCNAIIIARRGAVFLKRWMERYETFKDGEWNYHSVLLPKKMADEAERDGRGEVCPLAPNVLFWPTWTDRSIHWMHKDLSKGEMVAFQRQLDENGGAMFRDQLAYHAWSQMTYKKYLKGLTVERIRSRDTRFHVLLRRFIDEL